MDKSVFYEGEKLYRAIKPISPFISEEDGSITSAAFNDPNGLSVDKQMHRDNDEAVKFMNSNLEGNIFSVTKEDCDFKNIHYIYCPLENNIYHSELHQNNEKKKLTKSQARHLAKVCKKEF